jgi:hypothetical protein
MPREDVTVTQIDWGAELEHPRTYLKGAIQLHGLSAVVGALCDAVADLRDEGRLSSTPAALDEAEALDLVTGRGE